MDTSSLRPMTPAASTTARRVERLVAGQPTEDGAGVRLVRLLTADLQRRLDPFLMLDRFGTDRPDDYIAGFPDHPHRGFETVTVMLQGRMRHRDSAGHESVMTPGGVQWMTAGRGIVHSEMPEQEEGAMEGFQLWLNLPAAEKMCAPQYRDVAPADVPEVARPGAVVRVIAGQFGGTDGAVQRPHTEPLILDIALQAHASLTVPVPATHHAFLVAYRGGVDVGGTAVTGDRLALLADGGDEIRLQAGADGARVYLAAGRPLREPIVQYGPFVMNTRQEILQAFEDFSAGRFGH